MSITGFRACRRSLAEGRAAVSAGLWGAALASALSACSTLPASGPTAAEVTKSVRSDAGLGGRIIDIDAATARDSEETSPAPSLASLSAPGRVDLIGVGDGLRISIYEVGVTLFSNAAVTGAGGGGGGFDPAARGTTIDELLVDREGDVLMPFIGRLHVAGRTPDAVAQELQVRLAKLSQSPQVDVRIIAPSFDTAYVFGAVRQPGRLALGLPQERLLDILARAGGAAAGLESAPPDDIVVRLTRGGRSKEARLSTIAPGGAEDLLILPGDRVQLLNQPRTFLVFGSAGKVSQMPFGASRVSLAEALARVGGPDERVADPSGVYLFRVTPAAVGAEGAGDPAKRALVYHLDLRKPGSYLASQIFAMQDKDVIYIASAASDAPGKLAQIIGQLAAPFLSARAVTN